MRSYELANYLLDHPDMNIFMSADEEGNNYGSLNYDSINYIKDDLGQFVVLYPISENLDWEDLYANND